MEAHPFLKKHKLKAKTCDHLLNDNIHVTKTFNANEEGKIY